VLKNEAIETVLHLFFAISSLLSLMAGNRRLSSTSNLDHLLHLPELLPFVQIMYCTYIIMLHDVFSVFHLNLAVQYTFIQHFSSYWFIKQFTLSCSWKT